MVFSTSKDKKNNTVKLLHKEFRPEGIFLDYKIIIKDKIKSLTISNIITTVNKSCKASKWEESGLEYPIIFKNMAFKCLMLDKKSVIKSPIMVSSTDNFEFFKINKLNTNKGTLYGYEMKVIEEFKQIEFDLRIAFDSKDKMIQSTFEFDFEEDN